MKMLINLTALALILGSLAEFAANADQIDLYPGRGRQIINCKSSGYNYNECFVGRHNRVRLLRQRSHSPCVEFQSWGYDQRRGSIWVDRGCEGEFEVIDQGGGYPPPGGGYPPPGGGVDYINCESHNYRPNRCATGLNRGVRLVRQTSRARCAHGYDWGFDRRSIWVDNGCSGTFEVRY